MEGHQRNIKTQTNAKALVVRDVKESCKANFAGLVLMVSKKETSDQKVNLIRDG